MAVEEADFVFVECGGLQLGGSSEEQLGGVDDFAVGVLHGFHHGGADVAFARGGGEVAAALTMRALIWRILTMFCSSLSRVMRLPLLISAIILPHSVRLSASMNRHTSVERKGQEFGGDNGDGGADEDVHGAHESGCRASCCCCRR